MKRLLLACLSALVNVTVGLALADGAEAEYLEAHDFESLSLDNYLVQATASDSATGLIYASALTLGANESSIIVIDPESAAIIDDVQLPQTRTTAMAISSDGQFLYLALLPTIEIVQYELPSLNLVRTIGPADSSGQYITSLSVVPDRSNSVIAVTQVSLTMFIDGIVQPDRLEVFHASRAEFSDLDPTTVVFNVDSSPVSQNFYTAKITATGLDNLVGIPSPGLVIVAVAGGQLYDRTGKITSLQTGELLGQLDIPSDGSPYPAGNGNVFTVSAARHRAYYINSFSQSSYVSVFDTASRARIDHFEVPTGIVSALRSSVSLWGDDNIAFTTSGDAHFIRLEVEYGSFGELTPLSPSRILDTRDGTGRNGRLGPVGEAEQIDVQITGVGGVPTTGVDSVVLNATVTEPTGTGYISVFPAGIRRPVVSNLNFVPGQTVANLVTVFVGVDGRLTVFNSAGSTQVIFDVSGYYSTEDGPAGSRYHALEPARLIDTRDGSTGGAIVANGTLSVNIADRLGVPSAGTTAAIINVTAVGPTSPGYLTVWPGDVQRPLASNVNFIPGLTVPNLAVVRVPPSGKINVYNSGGATHVILDIVGYFDEVRSGNTGRLLTNVEPFRSIDTREDSPFPPPGSLFPDSSLFLPGVADGPTGYVLNVTVTEPTEPGHITVFPGTGDPPLASNVNFTPGRTVANLVITRTGPGVSFYNSAGDTHLIVDVFAIFS